MALPIVKVTLPSVLAGQANGRIAPNLLTRINMPGGGTAEVLAQAAPKWNALLAAAAQAGFALSHEGDYRTYNEQVALFEQRFTTTYRAGATTRTWNGQTWYLKPGYALAAVPGTSNHGWGLALDLCMAGGQSITQAAVNWLTAYASAFGMSAEVQSEDWHWRPYDGDHYTDAVLAYEGDDMTPAEWNPDKYAYGTTQMLDKLKIVPNADKAPGPEVEVDNKLVLFLKALDAKVDKLAAKQNDPIDYDLLAAKILDKLGDAQAEKVADLLAERLKA